MVIGCTLVAGVVALGIAGAGSASAAGAGAASAAGAVAPAPGADGGIVQQAGVELIPAAQAEQASPEAPAADTETTTAPAAEAPTTEAAPADSPTTISTSGVVIELIPATSSEMAVAGETPDGGSSAGVAPDAQGESDGLPAEGSVMGEHESGAAGSAGTDDSAGAATASAGMTEFASAGHPAGTGADSDGGHALMWVLAAAAVALLAGAGIVLSRGRKPVRH